ncbi:prolipoprotein diacylglyceryl transferase family protein [Amycolatopsis sp. NPDC006131]|uniref:prolipoprotein diacylglyceryl transferase family protein n=1 Tax=Amycolatopsis sp. NPDC006131 TaxID=3156731 RepID=UPI0033A298B9
MERATADADPRGLAVTYWFDAGASEVPCSLDVRFTGTRTGISGKPEQRDRFEVVEHVEAIPPGSGRVALTSRVLGVNPGTWRVTAAPVKRSADGANGAISTRLPRKVFTATTGYGPLVHGPGVRLVSWPLLVGLGAVVAILLQVVLAARAGISVVAVLALSAVGCALGFVGAKTWYLALHRKPLRSFLTGGACIQGFLLVALGVLVIGSAVLGLPVGSLLDATTPGIFLGMAVGRPGCFLTGCCAGRPTGSRWGLWSSDRRLALRRFPVQLVEAAVALLIGVGTLALVLAVESPAPGAIWAGALAAYTFVRQLLFPLRTQSRTRRGRVLTMVICGLVLAGAIAVSVAG